MYIEQEVGKETYQKVWHRKKKGRGTDIGIDVHRTKGTKCLYRIVPNVSMKQLINWNRTEHN